MTTDVDAYMAELQRLLGTSDAAHSVIREARSHLDDKVAALVRGGMTPEEAAREAVVAFGDAREFAFAALANGSLNAVPPPFLRWFMLAGTVLTGLVAGGALAAILLEAMFGGVGESPVALAVIGGGAAATILHAVALGRLLLRRRRHWLSRSGVLLGGIGLAAVGGAAIVFSAFDDAPGGVLVGLLLAAQGGAAVLTVAFPQLFPPRPLRA